MSAIDVKNLVKKFHGQTVLHGIDLEVQGGRSGGDHRAERVR
ncbi:putative amino-acid ABC transporter ATP-binding protein YecC [Leclercia adecarboxylata]|uniref:Putative amino-acid ABC transporter ATP-binding protein YecC n=1 Tax=Leclercia adecarboxylata TaxID=83655 RepID=A0A4U9HZ92_9ENTR|nr:putative amino-acid ABC transporter ATP-binding protein YecC [Leclercia adecarboxylata]